MKSSKKAKKPLKLQHDVLYSQVSKILTQAILEGQFEAGQKLVEPEIQKMLGISRSPLREAIRDLEKKGLVTIVPRRGAFVKEFTIKDIEDLVPVRSTLEALAAGLAYSIITDKDLGRMSDALEKMNKSLKSDDTNSYWQYHSLFHKIFITASNNQILIETLERLQMHNIWYRFNSQFQEKHLQKHFLIHQQIYDLFANPHANVKKLENLVQSHIEEAQKKFLKYLEKEKKGLK